MSTTSTFEDMVAGFGPIPVTNPATGWWTRAVLSDINKYPHSPIGRTPDIQPIGTDPYKQDFATILQNPAVDYSTAENIELVGNANNFFYMRGHSTLAGIDIQGRIFGLPTSTINYPSQVLTNGLRAQVLGSEGTVNHQSISFANPDQFYLFEKPFMISNPPNPNGHYCLTGEVRQKRQNYPVYPGWPTDDIQNYATMADFQAWVLSNPLMCWRNISWEPYQPSGLSTRPWSCTTQLDIPDASSYCSFWTITIECDNANIPDGSAWSLVSDDNKVFPNGKVFGTRAIKADPKAPPFAGAHFTGARPGYNTNLTLTVTWSGDGSKIPTQHSLEAFNDGVSLFVSPIIHLAIDSPPGSDGWPLYVTQDYPFIGNRLNPSPLPSFKAAGSNAWPYKDGMQFHVGQASVAARVA